MNEEAAHYHGHRERLRKRFLEAGDEALADYELIELILFRAIPRRDVKPLAKALLERFGSFAEVVAAPLARLKEVEGVSEGVAPNSRSSRPARSGSRAGIDQEAAARSAPGAR